MRRVLLGLSALICIANASAEWKGSVGGDIWSLPPSSTGSRWLVIHDRGSAAAEGIYHIEVLERATGDPLK